MLQGGTGGTSLAISGSECPLAEQWSAHALHGHQTTYIGAQSCVSRVRTVAEID